MKLKRNKASYSMPNDCSHIEAVAIKVSAGLMMCMQVKPERFFTELKTPSGEKTLGIPVYFTLYHGSIFFHPTPDKPYKAIGRYISIKEF